MSYKIKRKGIQYKAKIKRIELRKIKLKTINFKRKLIMKKAEELLFQFHLLCKYFSFWHF